MPENFFCVKFKEIKIYSKINKKKGKIQKLQLKIEKEIQ